MAAVSVFVDDAIRGDLPLVCAKTGEPADLMVRMRQPVGGMPTVAWLLLLAGPVGFLGLLLLALLWPGEHLTVRIPRPRRPTSGSASWSGSGWPPSDSV